MTRLRHVIPIVLAVLFIGSPAVAQTEPQKFEPKVGQAGKDVVWVPTPDVLVEKMLDMAEVAPTDFVMDLGSGDGRNIVAAAKRGARGVGVEYNPEMVALSRRLAAEAGVSERATFVEGDMYTADISKATVLALFLLPVNMNKLMPKFLDLRPGSRIVANTFGIDGWDPDQSETVSDASCTSWCTALLWIVPAKVAGTWRAPQGELQLKQDFQVLSGDVAMAGGTTPIQNGRMRGDEIRFSADGADYVARVNGDAMQGTVTLKGRQQNWSATRASQ